MTRVPFHMEPSLALYGQMLEQAGRAVNLVSRGDLGHLAERHLEPCHRFADLARELGPRRILDLGSGGGLPGIPLAIRLPEVPVLLCESVGKKAEFLQRVVRRLGLGNVEVHQKRIEALVLAELPDLITARFFGTVEQILTISQHHCGPETRYFLIKGEDEALPHALPGYRLAQKTPIGQGKQAVLYLPDSAKGSSR